MEKHSGTSFSVSVSMATVTRPLIFLFGIRMLYKPPWKSSPSESSKLVAFKIGHYSYLGLAILLVYPNLSNYLNCIYTNTYCLVLTMPDQRSGHAWLHSGGILYHNRGFPMYVFYSLTNCLTSYDINSGIHGITGS